MKSYKVTSLWACLILAATLSSILLTSCDGPVRAAPSADQTQARQTERAMAEAQRQVGMPAVVNFKQRKSLKHIIELCDSADMVCYAYLQSQWSGKLIFVGRCIGYGIPFSAQFTNPEKAKFVDGGEYSAINPYTMPQPDPNGLFMPTSSDATWLLMLDPSDGNKPKPVYWEPTITVAPFALTHGVENDTKVSMPSKAELEVAVEKLAVQLEK